MLAAALLNEIDGGIGAAAGSQHGIDNDQLTLFNIDGQLAVIFYGQVGLRIAVQADMADLCGGNDVQNAVHHAQTCAQDRYDAQLAAGDDLGLAFCNRRFDFNFLQRQVAGHFICHQHCDFVQQLAEILGAAIGSAHEGQLVLYERMIYYNYLTHIENLHIQRAGYPAPLLYWENYTPFNQKLQPCICKSMPKAAPNFVAGLPWRHCIS